MTIGAKRSNSDPSAASSRAAHRWTRSVMKPEQRVDWVFMSLSSCVGVPRYITSALPSKRK